VSLKGVPDWVRPVSDQVAAMERGEQQGSSRRSSRSRRYLLDVWFME
jgi:hypothetical protein